MNPMQLPIVRLPNGRTLHDPRLLWRWRFQAYRIAVIAVISCLFFGFGTSAVVDAAHGAAIGFALAALIAFGFDRLTRIWESDDRIYRENVERFRAKQEAG